MSMTMAGSDDIFELEDDLHESRSMPSDNIECSAARSSNLGSGTHKHLGKQHHRPSAYLKQLAPANMGVSVPISIPLKQKRPSSPNESPAANEFVPPHQLSQQSHSHLAQSLPLTSSAQLRTRDLLMSATGMLPRHGPDGPLLDQPHGAKTDSTAEDGSILASSHRPGSQRRWDQLPQHSPAGVAQCSGGLSCPGGEMQPFLRRTAPLRLFPMVPEGH